MITNSGTIFGRDQYGIWCTSAGGIINNTGIIEAGITPIVFDASAFSVMTINNGVGGLISTQDPVAYAAIYTSGAGAIALDNSGVINSIINCDASNAADVVINRGIILGDVFLGSGDDSFTSIDGTCGTVFGEGGSDTLVGGLKADVLNGGAGADKITGGRGSDLLIDSADGEVDTFFFNSAKDSVRGVNRDTILGFSQNDGDNIDLSAIDAKKGVAGNQTFKFIGTQNFHHKAGELHFKQVASQDYTLMEGDINGDGKADFQIELSGLITLIKGDFVL